MSEKIKPVHLSRKAILYIRQSSQFQVNYYQESKKLQYGMKARLKQLGWQDIEVIDDDLGISASGTEERCGFERMVAQVCMGKIGTVAYGDDNGHTTGSVTTYAYDEAYNISEKTLLKMEGGPHCRWVLPLFECDADCGRNIWRDHIHRLI